MTIISTAAETAREHARATDGRFGHQAHSAPDVTIPATFDEHRILTREQAAATIDTSQPVPQANSLMHVAVAVDAIAAGADTPDGIAEALSMDTRQGSYYGTAAAYLGLVERGSEDGGIRYTLTPLGEQTRDLGDRERLQLVRELAAETPAVASIREDVIDEETMAGLAESTASRREATAAAWARDIADAELDDAFEAEIADRQAVFAAAAETSRLQREELRAIAKSKIRKVSYCSTCFMELPVTGVCSTCD